MNIQKYVPKVFLQLYLRQTKSGRITNLHVVIVMEHSNILKLVECTINISSDI